MKAFSTSSGLDLIPRHEETQDRAFRFFIKLNFSPLVEPFTNAHDAKYPTPQFGNGLTRQRQLSSGGNTLAQSTDF